MLIEAAGRPDILEVIADLSNDAVFTPPRVANAVLDLLPEDVWSDPGLRWLDPGSKTGVFLREITRRLMVGLEDVIPEEQERLEHVMQNQVFGLATEALTALISRRTLYCSKIANGPNSVVAMPTITGNIWFDRVEHDYVKGLCTECSAFEEKMERGGRDNHAYALIHATGRAALREEFEMRFDVVIGNPPYQMEADAAGKNVTALYEEFIKQAKALDPRYISMIIPSRWMTGGRGLDSFRGDMLVGRHVRNLVSYENAKELFPSVGINGGVCYFLWDREHPGSCSATYRRQSEVVGPVERQLDEFDVYVQDHRALPILRKVRAAREDSLAESITTRDPFGPGLSSNIKSYRTEKGTSDVRLYMPRTGADERRWVDRSLATRNDFLVDAWKVLVT